ncbi:hypothetical protein CLLI_20690 [Clostridium liquoris]|uniref:Uncharacterized protein n=1 Tax=Clostridium liquoris TaxID=1289519 RepID=A0A2T0B245_9CLOT|nr:hypothetical protein CLLI_20690 [Clostridium liquoris]
MCCGMSSWSIEIIIGDEVGLMENKRLSKLKCKYLAVYVSSYLYKIITR